MLRSPKELLASRGQRLGFGDASFPEAPLQLPLMGGSHMGPILHPEAQLGTSRAAACQCAHCGGLLLSQLARLWIQLIPG